jgi:hypothetical protein
VLLLLLPLTPLANPGHSRPPQKEKTTNKQTKQGRESLQGTWAKIIVTIGLSIFIHFSIYEERVSLGIFNGKITCKVFFLTINRRNGSSNIIFIYLGHSHLAQKQAL